MVTTLERKIQQLAKILNDRPGDELTMLALAEASFRRGLKLEALTAYQEVISQHPVAEAYLAVAEIYADQSMLQEAYGELRRLFNLDPDNVEARLLINELQLDTIPPEDIRQIMETKAANTAFEETRLRLKIQRSIYHRELQERTRNATLEPGVVMHEYHMEEAKRKLIKIDELLSELNRFQQYNQELKAALPRPSLAAPSIMETVDEHDTLEEPPSLASEEDLTEASFLNAEIVVESEHEIPLESAEDQYPQKWQSDLENVFDSISEQDAEPDLDLEVERQLSGEEELPTPLVSLSNSSEAERSPSAKLDLDIGIASASAPATASPSPSLFPTEFAISMDSPLAPDLPDLNPIALESVPIEGSLDGPNGPPPLEEEIKFSKDMLDAQLEHQHQAELDVEEVAAEPLAMDENPSKSAESDIVETSDLVELSFEPAVEFLSEASATEESTAEPAHTGTIPIFEHRAVDPGLELYQEDSREGLPSNQWSPQDPSLSQQVTPTEKPSAPSYPEQPAIIIDDEILTGEEVTTATTVSEPEPMQLNYEAKTQSEVSAARKSFYQLHAEAISSLTATLARTRGVTSIFLVAREGITIDTSSKDNISGERIGELVKESFEFLESFSEDLSYWVLECSGGIFVMQRLDDRHVLIAVGQAGANFGALRYTMDKTKIKFEQLLAQVPK